MRPDSLGFIFWISCLFFCKSAGEIVDGFSVAPCPGGDDNVCNDNKTDTFTSSTVVETTTGKEEDEDEEGEIDLKVDFDNIGIARNTSTTPRPGTVRAVVLQNTTRQIKFDKVDRKKERVCPCDLIVSNCDINCCCDPDCEDYQLDAFSHCYDILPKNNDSRYCHNKHFIRTKLNTQFILDRIADNLFCIAKNNLPPLDSLVNSLSVETRKTFDDLLMGYNLKDKHSWIVGEAERPEAESVYVSSLYVHGDAFWTIRNNSIAKFELPLQGFTGQCSMKKQVEYLQDWESSCLQINLDKDNSWILSDYHSNMTILSSPKYLNTSAKDCPKNICIPIETRICLNSSSATCINSTTTSLPRTSCVNGTCTNAVRKFQYTVYHNGSSGVQSVKLQIELGNFTGAFHQHYGVEFRWWPMAKRGEVLLARSGNPGYVLGAPIIVGSMPVNGSNKAAAAAHDNIKLNQLNYTLQVPIALRNGRCSGEKKYRLSFGEDVKSRCSISLETANFSSTTCKKLHEQVLVAFFGNSLTNVTDVDGYPVYISRSGNVSNLNSTDWNRILLNRVPNNPVTGQIHQTKNQCSGLATSLTIDILYGLLPRTASEDHYKIVGVGMTLSEQRDVAWERKCPSAGGNANNCTDSLSLEIVSYVNFRDISTPAMYYYAGGPNLNLILSYDFFYPFLGRNNSSRFEFSTLLFIIIGIFCILF